MSTPWLTHLYKPFDFSNLASQPYDLPKSLKELPNFKGYHFQYAQDFLEIFNRSLNTMWVTHADTVMKFFSLALTGDTYR